MPKKFIQTGNPDHLKCQPEALYEHAPVLAWMRAFRANVHRAKLHERTAYAALALIGRHPHRLRQGLTDADIARSLGMTEDYVAAGMVIVSGLGVARWNGQHQAWVPFRADAGRKARERLVAVQWDRIGVPRSEAVDEARRGLRDRLATKAKEERVDLDALVDSIIPPPKEPS